MMPSWWENASIAHEQHGSGRHDAAVERHQGSSRAGIFRRADHHGRFHPRRQYSRTHRGIFRPLGYTVMIALAFSIIESQLILPAHLAHRRPEREPGGNALMDRWLALQGRISDSLEAAATEYYLPAVTAALRWRYLTVSWA